MMNNDDVFVDDITEAKDDDFLIDFEDTSDESPEVETKEDVPEVEEAADDTPDAEESPEGEKPFLMLKYNHGDLPIASEDEAKRLAQLGYHYQNKLAPEFDALKATAEKLTGFERIADLYGMDVDNLATTLYENYLQQQAAEQDVPVEVIRREKELEQREAKLKEVEAKEQSESQRQSMFQRFWDKFPTADPKEIRPETWEKVNAGKDLVEAFTEQKLADYETKLKQMEQQIQNKSKAPVKSVTSVGSKESIVEDDFLRGFES